MDRIILGIWQNAPGWVWPLFLVLLAVGLLSMKSRRSSTIPYFFYPLFGLSAAGSVGGLVHVPLNWVAFALCYLLGMGLAYRWQDGLILQKTGRRMQLKGDRITLAILMLIFFSNFVNGIVEAVGPQFLGAVMYTVVFASIIGAGSGSFTGRALRVITLGERGAPLART
ncbi:hypothetical protein [Microbulbifer sp. S227A]|uniref:hypothetical protein n=1 Tax=Microbulbifer sp. S227A TaxID=3415131 RepID=UPI003C7A1F5C